MSLLYIKYRPPRKNPVANDGTTAPRIILMITHVALSGSGWLFPWHVGVLAALRARPRALASASEGLRVTGTSGGAIVAVTDACGIAPEDAMKMSMEIAKQLRAQPPNANRGDTWLSSWGRMGGVLERALHEHLPTDAHERCNGGRGGITATPVRGPADKMVWREPELISHFTSRDDLIEACLASSHIPYYLDGELAREWRGRWWVDGGMLDILPPIAASDDNDDNSSIIIKSCPYETLKYVGKSLRPRADRHQIVSPGWSEFSLVTQLLPWTFHPAAQKNLLALYDAGLRRTESWLMDAQLDNPTIDNQTTKSKERSR